MSIYAAIKSKVNLREYLSKFMEFNAKDMASCPFHEDKTPSFVCRPTDEYAHCFSCGFHQDIFGFLEKYNGYSNMDAMKSLATELGLKFSKEDEAETFERQRLLDYNKKTAETAHNDLLANPEIMERLRSERALSLETINAFQIGYNLKLNAIFFPLRDRFGAVVGGAVRFYVVPEGREKYLNTKADKIGLFKKGQLLYGLSSVRNKVKGHIYLCEGYFDALSLNQCGFPALGMLSSLLTKEQLAILKQSVPKDVTIVLVPDTDETGLASIEKNYKALRPVFPDNSIRLAQMPSLFKDFNEYHVANKDEELDCPQLREPDSFLMKTTVVEAYLASEYLDKEDDVQKQYVKVRDFLGSIQSPIIKSQVMQQCAGFWNKPLDVIKSYFEAKGSGVEGVSVDGTEELLGAYEFYIKNINTTRIGLGYPDLAPIIRGGNMGEVLTVIGRSGVGKTAFGLNLAERITREKDVNLLFFSLEQQKAQIAERMLSISSGLPSHMLEKAFYDNSTDYMQAIAEFDKRFHNVFVVDKDNMTIDDIEKTIVETSMSRKPINVIIIDYMGYIKTKHADNPYVAMSNVAKELKAMAKRLNIFIIVLSQLSREGGTGGTKVTIRMCRDSVTGDTRILLADGRHVPIRDLAGTTPKVVCFDNEHRLTERDTELVWCKGRKKIYKVKTELGREIKCTISHPLFTADRGWVRLNDLKVGDRVAIPNDLPYFGDKKLPCAELLGHLLADGSLTHSPVAYTDGHSSIRNHVRKLAKDFGITAKNKKGEKETIVLSTDDWQYNHLTELLREYGVFGLKSPQRFVPRNVFEAREKDVAKFLKGYISSDGCVTSRGVFVSSASKKMAEDLVHLLLRFGIVSSLTHERHGKGGYKDGYYWKIGIVRGECVKLYLDKIGFSGDKQNKLLRLHKGRTTNHHQDLFPKTLWQEIHKSRIEKGLTWGALGKSGVVEKRDIDRKRLKYMATAVGNQRLLNLAESRLIFAKITKIEKLPNEELVYDMTVKEHHNFIADNVKVKNSGVVEESADMILGIWRPELAEKIDETKYKQMLIEGRFEVEVLKNRAGRCGHATLKFDHNILLIRDMPWNPEPPPEPEKPVATQADLPLGTEGEEKTNEKDV